MITFLRHGKGTFGPNHAIGPAEWPHHDLLLVHRGEIGIEFPQNERSLTLRRGHGVLIWPHTPFHGRALSPTAQASIQHFSIPRGAPEPFARLASQRGGFTSQQSPADPQLEKDVQRAIELAHRDTGLDRAKQIRTALLTLILAEGGFVASSAEALPLSAKTRIDLGALDTWLRGLGTKLPAVTEIAARFGLSPSRFRAVFLAEHGTTVGEFLLARREAEARRLLAETREPLKAIAAILGYADAVVFHRAFKSRVGQTPAAFRRQHMITG